MQTIHLDLIDINDRRFCVSYPMYDEGLISSIKKVGIIQPVMLLNMTPYIVITGFRRIASATQLGLADIPCVILDISEKEALLRSIHDNIKRGLNIIEKANSIERMLHMGFSSNEIYETAALLSINPHEKVIERLIAIANAENAFKDFVIKKGLSMKSVESMMRFDTDERAHIIDILAPIHTTESLTREILEILNIIKIRTDNIDFDTITGITKADELKMRLKKLASPILTSLEDRLKEIKLRCSLPPDIDIKVDPFFEKEYIDILIRAKTDEDIRDAIEKLENILDNGYAGSIFELIKG